MSCEFLVEIRFKNSSGGAGGFGKSLNRLQFQFVRYGAGWRQSRGQITNLGFGRTNMFGVKMSRVTYNESTSFSKLFRSDAGSLCS